MTEIRHSGADAHAAPSPLLEVAGLGIHFGGIVALDEVTFQVAQGRIVGLIGPNGAGKTTLFNCLSRLYRPRRGDIRLNGRSLRQSAPSDIAALRFYAALTRQCFINEYVYWYDDEEFENACHLRERVVAAMCAGHPGSELAIAVVAHYFPMKWQAWVSDFFAATPFYAQAAALMLLAVALQYVAATGVAPFIYTKF